MALSLVQKKSIAHDISALVADAQSAVLADFSGLTATDMDALRARARESAVNVQVVRLTLARRAVEGTEFECLKDRFVGPTIMFLSRQEPSAAPRLVRDFVKENEKLSVKALALGGQVYEAKDLNAIAKLPTKDEAIATLMRVMKAPVEKLVRTMAEPHAKLVRTVAAIKADKEAQA